jgi:polysaccharide pyruvyl transferase WcaK-like protein
VALALRCLAQVDTLIIAGGGQLDDFWGGPWGHPWALLKWTVLAKLREARVLFLSVGYGTLESRWSRLLSRTALSLANYRSYRDPGSRDLMRRSGFTRQDPVFPDLAYGRTDALPLSRRWQLDNPLPGAAIRTVGISPIAYCDPRAWPVHDRPAFEAYVESLTQAALWLIQTGRQVVFFASAGADNRVADEILARLAARLGPCGCALASRASVLTVDAFLEQASAVDLVIASRLHSLILAHLAGTPILAISYERKVDALMAAVGQDAYSIKIDALTLAEFQQVFAALEATWQGACAQLDAKRRQYHNLVQSQFDQVLSR